MFMEEALKEYQLNMKNSFLASRSSDGLMTNECLWEWRGNFIFHWIIREVHYAFTCDCSYCREFGHKLFGIALPECKAPNSWRIIYWRWKGNLHIIRWTLAK